MKLFTANKMSRCWRSWLLAGPRVQVKLLSDYQRWIRISDIAWLFIISVSCWISVAGREGGSCVPVWDAKLWFLLSVPGTCLCRQLDGSFPSAEHGSLRFAENNVFYSLVFSFRQVWLHFSGEARRLAFWECVSPLSHFCWGPWVSLVVSKGALVGLWAGDVLLFAPSAPPLKIW